MTYWKKIHKSKKNAFQETCRRESVSGKKEREKVNKGVRGMPWLSEAKKDVISCEKYRGVANTL